MNIRLILVLQGWFMIHRSDLHKELMRLALDPDAISHPPPTIRLGARITAINFDSEHPSVTTSSGEEFKFDLVLGADGIKVQGKHSTSHYVTEYRPENSPPSANAWSARNTTLLRLTWLPTDGC
jgi:hypothetical protein